MNADAVDVEDVRPVVRDEDDRRAAAFDVEDPLEPPRRQAAEPKRSSL
jgi:hypothetical protein